jgi:predicted AAA+ superfamily ATPase
VLKVSFVVFELPPFFENIRKRVVKSPKIYFSDVGLASYLLGIETSDQLFRDPLRGGLYENLVILEILKARLNCGKRPDLKILDYDLKFRSYVKLALLKIFF